MQTGNANQRKGFEYYGNKGAKRKIPLGTKGRTSILSYREYVRPAELHSPSAEENCMIENVASLRSVKVATPPCAAYAAIPCGLAVCKQHKMLFAASK